MLNTSASSSEPSLFTSLCYDPSLVSEEFNTAMSDSGPSSFMLLRYHLDRLHDSAKDLGWQSAVSRMAGTRIRDDMTQLITQAVLDHGPFKNGTAKRLRIRIQLSRDGLLTCHAFPARSRIAPSPALFATYVPGLSAPPEVYITVYLDIQPTPLSIYTTHKTTERSHYDNARARLGIEPASGTEEVLLHNDSGEVMECSIRNIAFWRDGGWTTPPTSSGCLPGVFRRWLLNVGHIKERTVLLTDVQVGEWVLLSNGVEGCTIGKITARK